MSIAVYTLIHVIHPLSTLEQRLRTRDVERLPGSPWEELL